jgi:FixJ family two-component response regulator
MADSEAVVFVIDDDPSIRKSLTRVLREAGYSIETFINPAEYLKREPYQGSGCIILDVRMPEMSGPELQEYLLQSGFTLPIVFITGYTDTHATVNAIKKGAIDFLVKPFRSTELLRAVSEAIKQDLETKKERTEDGELRRRYDHLTPREKQVYQGVIGGKLNKQIASDLNITEKTVKLHRGNLMLKMQAGSIAELVHFAERLHLPRQAVNTGLKS